MGSIRLINGKRTREYVAWKAMKSRCYSPANKNRGNYQAKQLQVCSRWINNFENFLEDMGDCPKGHSLDRIDNNLGYSPENCRWATDYEQANNRGDFNIVFTYQGASRTLKQWARALGIKYTTLYLRLTRSNLTFEEAISVDPFNKLIFYKGETKILKDWCIILNLPYSTIVDRKYQGWSVRDMFERPIKKVKI